MHGGPEPDVVVVGKYLTLGVHNFFSSRRRHTRCSRDWSSDVCSSDLRVFLVWHPWHGPGGVAVGPAFRPDRCAESAGGSQGTRDCIPESFGGSWVQGSEGADRNQVSQLEDSRITAIGVDCL